MPAIKTKNIATAMIPTTQKKYVAYYRVSTQRQGISGLGLEAQQHSVKNFVGSNLLISEYTEVESGRNNNRPILREALHYAKSNNATLVIAKIDRLARNARFTLELCESGIDFIALDCPEANRLVIGIMAVIAENESRMIGDRVKAAWKAKKARANYVAPMFPVEGAKKSLEVRQRKAENIVSQVMPTIQRLRNEGMTLERISKELNLSGYRTSRGCLWTKATVCKILKEYDNV